MKRGWMNCFLNEEEKWRVGMDAYGHRQLWPNADCPFWHISIPFPSIPTDGININPSPANSCNIFLVQNTP
jgi:hypothetical protein